ncbi:DUF998 domain-containing protein [Streptosporangium sp. NBC_01755]|uniref:DUF998 domain-containing protein n=1 Tax=unclassified Streptosporangium TaxID=2632669 RepID=UPI002DD9BB6A|nr:MULTISPECIES: DUF998 domain-containing protein [unclassified Streptosporangium]WSA23603.1 DUF998 domain-containing protein [Streptosporangium sp. NBC_01810]WSC98189.1 DUF998 domain-containing protein [Streptosporangium sp. NBC_01755]
MNENPSSRLPGVAGPLLALAAMGYAHMVSAGAVNPTKSLVSEYALRGDSAWVMAGGTIALAMGCLWVAYLLARVDPVRGAAARALFVASALGLLLTATFPTDAAPGVTSIGGEIHRWSAAVVFTALPCAGWMLGRRSGSRALAGAAVASVVLLAWFLAAHPGSLISDLIGGPDHYGLAQRLLLLAEMTLVFLAALRSGHREGDGVTGRLDHRKPGNDRGVTVPIQPGPDDARRPHQPIGLG